MAKPLLRNCERSSSRSCDLLKLFSASLVGKDNIAWLRHALKSTVESGLHCSRRLLWLVEREPKLPITDLTDTVMGWRNSLQRCKRRPDCLQPWCTSQARLGASAGFWELLQNAKHPVVPVANSNALIFRATRFRRMLLLRCFVSTLMET